MQTEMGLEVQERTKGTYITDSERYKKLYEIYKLSKEICKNVDYPIKIICVPGEYYKENYK